MNNSFTLTMFKSKKIFYILKWFLMAFLMLFLVAICCYGFLVAKDYWGVPQKNDSGIWPKDDNETLAVLPDGLALRATYLQVNEWYIPYSRISMIRYEEKEKEFVIFASPGPGETLVKGFGVDCSKLETTEIEKLVNKIMIRIDV